MSEIKKIRGQLRQIAQELLPQLTNDAQYQQLKRDVDTKIAEIEKFVKATMTEMNERHKDTMGYLVRTVTIPQDNEKK